MSNWKSCGNCSIVYDPYYCDMCLEWNEWKPILCPLCGGILSEIREHNGKKYRHCYACHFEYEEE